MFKIIILFLLSLNVFSSTLIVEEVETYLEQDCKARHRLLVKAVRPYLYKHLSPNNYLTLSIVQGGQTLSSKTLTTSDIENNSIQITAFNYYHGFITFEFDSVVVVNRGGFTVKLETNSYDESAYYGWIREYQNLTNNIDIEIENDFRNPLSLQIWSYQ